MQFKIFIPSAHDLEPEEIDRIKIMQPSDAIVKIRNNYINSSFKRNQWVKIKNEKQVIYRIVRGATATGLTDDKIWMSYDSKLELGITTQKNAEVKVSKANIYETYILAPWNTPNIVERNLFRMATILGLISVLLGFIGLLT